MFPLLPKNLLFPSDFSFYPSTVHPPTAIAFFIWTAIVILFYFILFSTRFTVGLRTEPCTSKNNRSEFLASGIVFIVDTICAKKRSTIVQVR